MEEKTALAITENENDFIQVPFSSLQRKRNVVESNTVVEAYMDLNADAQKILYTTIAMIGKDDKEFLGYTFQVKDLQRVFGVTSKNFYDRVKEAALRLMQCVIMISTTDKEKFEAFHLIRKATYDKGKLSIKLDEEVSEFFLQLKSNFTQVPLEFFLELTSANSMRILNLIVSRWNIAIRNIPAKKRLDFSHSFVIDVETIRKMFFYKTNKPSMLEFKNLKAKLLEPTVREINEKSIFSVKLSYITGSKKKVEKVKFSIEYNERGKTLQLQSGSFPELIYLDWTEGRKICKYFKEVFEIPEKQIIALHDKYTDHELKAAYLSMYEYLQEYSGAHYWEVPTDKEERGVIKVPIAFLKSTLKNRSYEDLEHLEIESGSKKLTEKSKKLIDEYFDQEYPFKWEEN